MENSGRAPIWFAVLVVAVALPSLFLSFEASRVIAESGWFSAQLGGWLYPVYIIVSAVSSWMCYSSRRALSWILLALIVMADAGLLALMFNT